MGVNNAVTGCVCASYGREILGGEGKTQQIKKTIYHLFQQKPFHSSFSSSSFSPLRFGQGSQISHLHGSGESGNRDDGSMSVLNAGAQDIKK